MNQSPPTSGVASMREKEYGDTFLLAPFREFYREVIRLKRMVMSGAWVAPSSSVGAEGEEMKAGAGTWVYFPDVIPGTEVEEEREIKTSAWVAPAGTVAPWDTPAHKGNGSSSVSSSSSPSSSSSEIGGQLAPSDEIKVSTFVWQRLVSLFERQ